MDASDREEFTATFNQLLDRGRSYACSFADPDLYGAKTAGTIYIDGSTENVRADYTTTEDGKDVQSSMIHKGNTTYVWTSAQEQGFIVTMTEEEDSKFGSADGDVDIGLDAEQSVHFTCEKWRVDSSKFTPPSDRQFVDIKAMMEGMMRGLDDGRTMPSPMNMEEGAEMQAVPPSQCALCDTVPADQKESCREAFGC